MAWWNPVNWFESWLNGVQGKPTSPSYTNVPSPPTGTVTLSPYFLPNTTIGPYDPSKIGPPPLGTQPTMPQVPQIPQVPQTPPQSLYTPKDPFKANPYLDMLFKQNLGAIKSNQPKMPSAKEILKNATSQANSQFNPQIQALLAAMGAQEKKSKAAAGSLKKLYSQVAASYGPMAQESVAEFGAASQNEKDRLTSIQQSLASQYNATAGQQADEFAKLGIQAALPESLAEQQSDASFLDKAAQTNSANAQSALQILGTGDRDFWQRSGGIATMRGADAQRDVMSRLQDYLMESRNSIATMKAQRQSAIEQLKQQLTSDATQQINAYNEKSFDNMFKMMQFYNTVQNQETDRQDKYNLKQMDLNAQTEQGSRGKQPKPNYKGLQGAMTVASETVGPTNAQVLMAPFYKFITSQSEMVNNQFKANGEPTTMNPQKAAALASQFAASENLNPQLRTAFVNMILAYLGKY